MRRQPVRDTSVDIGLLARGIALIRWEYCEIDLCDTFRDLDEVDILNRAGADGWELVAIRSPYRAILKRPIASAGRPRAVTKAARSPSVPEPPNVGT